MKRLFILAIVLFFFTANGFSQVQRTSYIELRGSVDALGNIKIMALPEKKTPGTDTTLHIKSINTLISQGKNAIEVINLLSSEGWTLVSAIAINKDENGRPNSPFLAYYFKKEL